MVHSRGRVVTVVAGIRLKRTRLRVAGRRSVAGGTGGSISGARLTGPVGRGGRDEIRALLVHIPL